MPPRSGHMVIPIGRREFIITLGAATVAWPLPLSAQAPSRLPKLGVLWPGSSPDKWDEAFRQGLHTLGYVEGRNILVEYRWGKTGAPPRPCGGTSWAKG